MKKPYGIISQLKVRGTISQGHFVVTTLEAPTMVGVEESVDGYVITWEDNSTNEEGFQVWVNIDDGGYELLHTTAANVESYEDTVSEGDSIYYKVRAYRLDVYSAFSEEVEAFDWEAYWAENFTGIPIEYGGNPLTANGSCLFRSIINVSGTYHIFEEVIAADWYIQKRTSADGLTLGAASGNLFSYGAPGTFDEKGQADPTVIYDGPGDWKMWFDAKNGASVWDKLGYATSTDGTTWTKVGAILERGAAGTWDDYAVHHPCAIKHNGVYYLYYSGDDDVDYAVKNIGLATSTDGINWTKYASNPVLSIGAGTWDSLYLRPSCPILIHGLWYMWYWGFGGTTHKMGLATSPDLFTWTKSGMVLTAFLGVQASMPILRSGTNQADKIVQIWFTGSAATYYLNLATAAITPNGFKLSGFTLTSGNIYQIALGKEPTNIYFNSVDGTKKTSIVTVDSEYNWYWASNVLYIYSTELPDVRYQIYHLADSLGAWAINETSGNVIDSMGLHDGVPSNVTQQVTGGVFNGTTSKIDLGNNFNFERTDKFTIRASVKRIGVGGTNFIFSKQLSSGNYTGIGIYFDTQNKIQYQLVSTPTNSIQKKTNGAFADVDNFIDIRLTYDGSSTAAGLKLYVNGLLQASSTSANNLSTSIVNNASFLIGSRDTALAVNAVIKNFSIQDYIH